MGGIRSLLVQPAIDSEREAPGCGAVVAALGSALAAPRDAPLHFILETDDLINVLFKNLQGWEDVGWIGIRGATYAKALVNQLRQRNAPTTFRRASTASERDALAQSREERTNSLRDGPPQALRPIEKAAFRLSGAKLGSLTQAVAYRGIRELTAPPPRTSTTVQIEATRDHLRAIPNADDEELDIWEGIRHKDIRRTVTDFLWKCAHRAHRVGHFWSKIPNYEDRATCPRCHELDSIEHILLHCSATGQGMVWQLVEKAWRRKNAEWPALTLHDIIAIGPRSRALTPDKPTPGHLARLWRILISESAHLIWRLRCERVIGHSDDTAWHHTPDSVAARWMAAMNSRLRQDVTGTSYKYGRLALKKGLILQTWRHLLEGEKDLPADWITKRRVLVGIDPEVAAMPVPREPRVPH
ncbi:hypothetical protein FOMPIDRAFT_1136984 [Fomitopsis schrenkii]|uniref:Reverse transcriptase zinc-binding domain-containing protein n=1 Tax=Fomitopsis schrenkii TaxID=2126942 RepID=S8F1X0_FOMSC|nr:hypothetical protein FOMPIDRAFT_1136984 [Fomitopsis schrenkii]